jgi:glutathione synthase/RimK-type ligase-like ATP-grasp enzyme
VKTVAVIGSSNDEHTRYVAEAVQRRRARVLLVETANVPESATLTWERGAVRYQGERLDDVRSFYIKRVQLSLPIPEPAALPARNFPTFQEQYVAERERQSFLQSVLRALNRPGRSFVNPFETIELHYLKLHQLELLRRHKVPVPPSLGTCDPQAVRDFVREHGRVIYKPLGGGALVQRVTEADLTDERLQLLGNCPVLFQAEIQGDEFRAYVLDGEPVSAFRIPTEGVVDARQNLHQVRPARLPEEAWKLCIRGARALGMVFTAVDLRRDKEGRFVALEFNPTPAISFFEDPKRGKVISRLAEYLVAKA